MLKKCFRNFIATLILVTICGNISVFFRHELQAATVDELKDKINVRTKEIQNLVKEIDVYKTELEVTGRQATTLQNTVKTLNLTEKKLGTDLKVTVSKIDTASLTIEKLSEEIEDKEKKMDDRKITLRGSLRRINELDKNSLIEIMLSGTSIASAWSAVENLGSFQGKVREDLDEVRLLKKELESSKEEKENQKSSLVELHDELADQKKVVEYNKFEKGKLLAETKEKESNYQKLLADRLAKKQAFERELLEFESQLKIQIDPNSIPKSGSGVLMWPVTPVKVTQEFGDTEFSRTHTQVYSGKGHNGVDFAAPVGTAIKSAASGVIESFGDTDIVCPRASYGKWVLVKHDNGLSTLYAHLSVIKVTTGQKVTVGDIIGYSGNTGYSTGPHLHFTVYATQGVRVMQKQSLVCGGAYTMPIADLKAYLNPLLYL